MSISLALALIVLGMVTLIVAALAATRSGARIGVAVAAAGLLVPAITDTSPLARAFVGIAFLMCFVRSLDLLRGPTIPEPGRRILHLLVVADSRRGHRIAREVSVPAVARAVAWLGVLATVVMVLLLPAAAALPRVWQWALVAVFIVAMFEGTEALVSVMGRAAFGFRTPVLSRQPYESRTLSEFWGRRWNPVISGVLRDHCFTPLARRPRLALAAAFLGSAALHFYLGTVSLDMTMAASLGLFFVIQPPLLLAERRLQVRRWPRYAGAAWTIGTLVLAWPLVAEPLLRLLRP